jgi:glycosyltransferase involved in cell wall biosynthesis
MNLANRAGSQQPAASSPLHIAFDARMLHYRRAGGIGQYTLSLLRALAELPEAWGSRVDLLQMRADRRPAVRAPLFRRVPLRTPPHHRWEQPALGLELLTLRPQPHLIHTPDFVPPRYRRFRAVANIHDLAFLKFPELTLLDEESKRYYGQVPRAAHHADALIALSESARDDIVEMLGVPPTKVAVIPAAAGSHFTPPADVEAAQRAAALKHGLPAPEEGGYILFVSTIEPRKNIPLLLEAYSLVRDRGRVSPMPVLALAGREGWLYEQVYRRIDELKLRTCVKLLGGVPEGSLPELYRGARLFCLPSIYEGFGLPALEALACGVPTIVSTGGSLPEVVGEAGIALSPHDPEAWAAAIERVLLDKDEAERLRTLGPRHAARFSWHRAASETWALYERILNS